MFLSNILLRNILVCVYGGDGGESNSPSSELPAGIYYRLVQYLFLAPRVPYWLESLGSQPMLLIS